MLRGRLRRLLGAAGRRGWSTKLWQDLLLAPAGMKLISVLAGLLLLTLTVLATQAQRRTEQHQQQMLVGERLKGLEALLTHRLPAALALSEGLGNIVAHRGDIEATLFVQIVEGFAQEEALIRGVSLIRGTDIVQTLSTHGQRTGAEAIEPAARQAALTAIRGSRSSLTVGPVALPEGDAALVAYAPVFLAPQIKSRERDRYWGAVAVLLDAQQLFARLQLASTQAGLLTAMRAVRQPGEAGQVLWGDGALFDMPHVSTRMALPGAGEWELVALPEGGWRDWSEPTAALAVLGALMSVGSAVLVYVTLRSRARIRFMAFHDALTRLPNRRMFQERLAEALLRAQRDEEHGALLLVDLDGFKQINDRLGHAAGDTALWLLAERMREELPVPHLVARTGGDEFAVLLREVAGLPQAAEVAERLIRSLSRPLELGGGAVGRVGASVGIALFPHDGTDMVSLLVRTDEALYHVKQNGRNGHAWVGAFRAVQPARTAAS